MAANATPTDGVGSKEHVAYLLMLKMIEYGAKIDPPDDILTLYSRCLKTVQGTPISPVPLSQSSPPR